MHRRTLKFASLGASKMIPLQPALQITRQAAASGQHEQAESIYQRIVAALPLEALVWNELSGVQHARRAQFRVGGHQIELNDQPRPYGQVVEPRTICSYHGRRSTDRSQHYAQIDCTPCC